MASLDSRIKAKEARLKKKFTKTATRRKAIDAMRKKLHFEVIQANAAAERAGEAAADADPDIVLMRAVSDVRKGMPEDHNFAGMVDRLDTAVKAAVHQKKYDQVRSTLSKQFESLSKVGDKHEVTLNVEVGAALESTSAARLRVTYVHGEKFLLERLADGRYKAQRGRSAGVKAGAKLGFASDVNTGTGTLSAYVAHTWEQARTYDSLEDLVTSESNFILDRGMPGSDHKEPTRFLKKWQQLMTESKAQRLKLERDLKLVGAIKPNETLEDPEVAGIRMVRKQIRTMTGDARGGVKFQMGKSVQDGGLVGGGAGIGVGGLVTVTRRTEREFKRFSFLDDVSDNAVLRGFRMMAKPANIHFEKDRKPPADPDAAADPAQAKPIQLQGAAAVKEMETVRQTLEKLRDTKDGLKDENKHLIETYRKRIWKSLESLDAEYDLYLAAHNEMEDSAAAYKKAKLKDKMPLARSRAGAKKLRKQLAENRGVESKDVAGYLQSVSLQYAALDHLFRATYEASGQTLDSNSGKTSEQVERDGKYRTRLHRLKDNLRTPRIILNKKDADKVYGAEAAKNQAIIKTVTVNGNVAAVATAARETKQVGDKKGDKTSKSHKLIGPSIKLSATWARESKTQPNSVESDVSVSIQLSGDLSILRPSLYGRQADSQEQGPDTKALDNVTSSLLSPKALGAMGVGGATEEEAAEVVDAVKQLLKRRNPIPGDHQTLQLDFTSTHGRLRLKATTTVELDTKKFSVGASIPTGIPVNVAIQMVRERNRKRIQHQFRGAKTLSGVTDVFRASGGGDTWKRFKTGSGLLSRMASQLSKDGTDGVAADGKDKGGSTLKEILTNIKNGTLDPAQKKASLLHTKDKPKETFGLANDVVAWLMDLKGGEKSEQDAADAFIQVYLDHGEALTKTYANGKPGGAKIGKQKKKDAEDALEKALDNLIQVKKAKEDRTQDDHFVKSVSLSDSFLRQQVANRLELQTKTLAETCMLLEDQLDPGKAKDNKQPTSMAQLRRRALKYFRRRVKTPTDSMGAEEKKQIKESNADALLFLQKVLALEHVSTTVDDLTTLNNEADRRQVIGMVGSNLNDLLNKPGKMRVHLGGGMGDLAEGKLEMKDGKLKVVPVIKKGKAPMVKPKRFKEAVKSTEWDFHYASAGTEAFDLTKDSIMNIKRRKDASGYVSVTHRPVLDGTTVESTTSEIKWKKSMYDPIAEQGYHKELGKKRGHKLFAESAGKRVRGIRHALRRKHIGIGDLLRKVMQAEAEKNFRKKRNQQQTSQRRLVGAD